MNLSKTMILLFMILLLLEKAKPQESDDEKKTKVIRMSYGHAEYSTYLLIFLHTVLLAILRHVVHVNECVVSYGVFSVALGIALGFGSLYSEWMQMLCRIQKDILESEVSLYLSLTIFGTAFCLDIHTFFKSLHQIVIISIPVALSSSCVIGILMKLILNQGWQLTDAILFGLLFIPIYPFGLARWMGETGSQTKWVSVLLQGETLIANVFGFYVFQVTKLSVDGWIAHWFQYLMGAMRILCGLPIGYIVGLMGNCLLRTAYNDGLHLALITIIMCYSSFYVFENLISTGIIVCLMVGIMMGIERSALPSETERFIEDVWTVIALIMNGVILLTSGITIPQVLANSVSAKDVMLVFVTYILCNITRFLSFLFFSPVISRIGYGFTFRNMVICFWGGLKNPVILCYAYLLKDTYPERKAKIFFLHAAGVYVLYLVINCTFFPVLLKILRLSTISVTRQVTMNNCMKYVLQARERTIAILKMDRFLSDANWPLVTSATDMKHPYKKRNTDLKEENEDEGDEEYFMGYRFTVCPDCKKHIRNEPTCKEMRDMTREGKIRVLKLRKIFYSRRYEYGLITKEGVRIGHQSVEAALDSEEKYIQVDGLIKMFDRENPFYRCVLNRLMYFLRTKEDTSKPPKNHYRLVCYKVISHRSFIVVTSLLTLFNLAAVIFCLVTMPKVHTNDFYALFACNFILNVLFISEIVVKILGYSWLYIYQHGIKRYIKSCMDVINLIVTCATTTVLIINTFGMIFPAFALSQTFKIFLYIIESVRLSRCVCLLQCFLWCKNFYPKIVRYFDLKVDKHRCLAYELGKNFICGEEEILENLPHVIDNDKIREDLKRKIEHDKNLVTEAFGSGQKDRPWVAVTTKTKLVIGTVLNSMKEDIYELKASGWMDDLEYNKLLKSLGERYRYANSIKSVQILSPKVIFKEVVWMGDDANIIKFLFENVTSKKFDPGDTICAEGEMPEGIYILISGLLLLTYNVQKPVKDKLLENGVLPVVDYVSCTYFENDEVEFLIPGNTIGELSTLTERPYNCTITAQAHSHVYILRREVVKQAMEQDADPINGLECRIWKSIAFKYATSLLMNLTAYRSFTRQKIEYILERAFLPNISNVKVFVVNEMMEDVLLIEGVAVDLHTRDVFTGPCYIPRSVQSLILPRSSTLNMEVEVETKLMILPAKDFDEYEIMMNAEQTCEMVSESATKCLQHIVQDRIAKRKFSKRRRQTSKGKLSRDSSVMTKSRITFASHHEEAQLKEKS